MSSLTWRKSINAEGEASRDFHRRQQGLAAGEQLGIGMVGEVRRRRFDVGGMKIFEGMHGTPLLRGL